MIVFDLKCDAGHQFEAWFKSSAAYEEQKLAGHVTCPYCDSPNITKAPMAPNIGAKSNQKSDLVPATTVQQPVAPAMPQTAPVAGNQPDGKLGELVEAAEKMIAEVREHVKENCDYVGNNFAEEARKIHYGESEERGIYGESTKEETMELLDEGIDVLPLPTQRQTDS